MFQGETGFFFYPFENIYHSSVSRILLKLSANLNILIIEFELKIINILNGVYMTEFIVIFVTASSPEEAQKIAHTLVEEKLAACVNVLSPVQSIFRWQNQLCNEQETLLILKTASSKANAVIERVQHLHSYDVPEVIALPIITGSREYLNWVQSEIE